MLRIKTLVGEGRVFTLYFMDKWVTIMSFPNSSRRSKSTDASTLVEAGENHLAYCKILKEEQNVQRGRLTPQLLHGTGHNGIDSRGISDRHDGPDREGSNGDGGEGRTEVLSSNSSGEENQNTPQLQSQESELKS